MTSVRQIQAAREFERQQAAAATAKATAQLAQNTGALIAKTNEIVKQFWSRPAKEIASVQYDQLGEGTDEGTELPIGDGSLDRAKVIEAFNKFTKALNDKGFTLSRDGRTRLLTYVGYQYRARNVDSHNVQSYINGFDRLYALGCFGDEVGWDANLVREPSPETVTQSQPEPDLTSIDIESIPVSGTREAEAKARKVVAAHFESAIGGIVNEWITSLQAEPWNVVLGHNEWLVVVRRLEALFREQNLPIVPRSFDLARRIFTKDGTLPPGLLLEDEALAERLELTTLTNNRNARLEFVAQSRKIRG